MKDRHSITFLEDYDAPKVTNRYNFTKLYRDEVSGEVQIEHLMQIELEEDDWTRDAYLLD